MGVIAPESTIAALPGPPAVAPFPSLIEAASLELHAALQLLVERARFLTAADGVAVATGAGRDFSYVASVGASVPAMDDVAEAVSGPIGDAISKLRPVAAAVNSRFCLVVPILQEQRVLGFFHLCSSRAPFAEHDINSLARLARLALTALELRESAEHAEARIYAGQEKPKLNQRPLWHAPAVAPEKPTGELQDSTPTREALAEKCWWCGFPVSPGRKLCLDCEEKNLSNVSPEEKPLFEMEKDETWLSRHGYTIASVLVSVLAGVVIYLLR